MYCLLLPSPLSPVLVRVPLRLTATRGRTAIPRTNNLGDSAKLRCGEAVALGGFPDLSKLLNPKGGSPR
ncbi:MAG: hypothetical protein AAFQ80_20180 [Cyanobacteria bacterium J06621_8]